ncbi:O-antigen ligase family protein [Priestia megaterium]|uniref:O-antigen ligase family protein n=1 Tax=Priestia megaterium TaxID=1404 RepID=UPI002B2464AE|nr:O-antigen ligase family protein [Priestia megaterium]MEB2289971.1 O-antigen ligase family protein [Priestia megaterium]
MQVKKNTLIVACILLIIFLNERMFYTLQSDSSVHVKLLLLLTFSLFIVYIKFFFTKQYLFRGIVIFYLVINLFSLLTTNLKFGQPIDLAIMRYKYIMVMLIYFPITAIIFKVGTEFVKSLIIKVTTFLSVIYIIQWLTYPSLMFLKVAYAERFGFVRFYDGSFFITVGLFCTISYLYNKPKSLEKIKYYTAFFLQIVYLIFVAQTRSSILTILVIITILLISKVSLKNISNTFKVGALLVVGSLILFPYVQNVFFSLKEDISRNEGTAYIRVQATDYMKEKIKENPLFGVGLYNAKYVEGDSIDGSIYKYYPEDVGITGFTFQYGLAGLILYIAMMIKLIYFTYKIFKGNRKKSIFYIILCLYFCFQMPFTIPLNVDNNLIYIAIIMGLIQIDYYTTIRQKQMPSNVRINTSTKGKMFKKVKNTNNVKTITKGY